MGKVNQAAFELRERIGYATVEAGKLSGGPSTFGADFLKYLLECHADDWSEFSLGQLSGVAELMEGYAQHLKDKQVLRETDPVGKAIEDAFIDAEEERRDKYRPRLPYKDD